MTRSKTYAPLIRLTSTVAAILLALTGCGDTKRKSATPVPSQRNGESVPSAELRYQDVRPVLSDSGRRLTFLSGRSNIAMRAMKFDLDVADAAAARVTADDAITSETDALLSPSGEWILILGTKASSRDLFLVPFAGGATVQLTTDAEIEGNLAFSPDSQLYAFIRRSNPRSGGRIVVGRIGAGSTAETQPIGSETEVVDGLAWIPVSSGWRLATARRNSGVLDWSIRDFATWEAAPQAQALALVSGFVPADATPQLETSATRVTAVRSVRPLGSRLIGEVGENVDAARQYVVRSEPALFDATGTDVSLATPPMLDIRRASLSANGDRLLVLGKESVRCKVEEPASTRTTLVDVATTAGGTSSRLFLKADTVVGPWQLVASPCGPLAADGVTPAILDFSVVDAIWAKSADPATATIAYVSTVTGDPEVRVIVRSSDPTTIVEVSKNAKPAQ